jgi:GNAT superfamily N-acetyltransferase
MPIEVRALTPDDWPLLARLFGATGACGGCWCMHWLMKRGHDWDREKGARNRAAFRRRVRAGKVHGVIATRDDEPIGWCHLGPRGGFPRLLRSRVIDTDADDDDWAVVCFYIPAAQRGGGVAKRLLGGAVKLAREQGARRLEGYPVRVTQGRYPSTFAFVGVPRVFEAAGFRDVTPRGARRPVFQRRFRR